MAEPVPAFELPLGRLVDRFGLSEYQAGQLGRFAAILVHDDNAPTTVRKPKLVRDDHLADALVALELPVIREARDDRRPGRGCWRARYPAGGRAAAGAGPSGRGKRA